MSSVASHRPQPEPAAVSMRPSIPQKRDQPNTGLMGAIAFIIAESVFFLGLFLAYFYLRSDAALVSDQPRAPVLLPLMNTIVLAISVVAATWAVRGIMRNNQRRLIAGMTIAAALGLIFMTVQSFEFAHIAQLGFTPTGSSFGSTFFALLIFHVLRVFAGVTFMVIVVIRALLGQFSARRRSAVQACVAYWYFIAAVWLVVFGVLYFG